MKTVQFDVVRTTFSECNSVEIPDEVVSKGKQEIIKWLDENNHYDNAMDYGETNRKFDIFVRD